MAFQNGLWYSLFSVCCDIFITLICPGTSDFWHYQFVHANGGTAYNGEQRETCPQRTVQHNTTCAHTRMTSPWVEFHLKGRCFQGVPPCMHTHMYTQTQHTQTTLHNKCMHMCEWFCLKSDLVLKACVFKGYHDAHSHTPPPQHTLHTTPQTYTHTEEILHGLCTVSSLENLSLICHCIWMNISLY